MNPNKFPGSERDKTGDLLLGFGDDLNLDLDMAEGAEGQTVVPLNELPDHDVLVQVEREDDLDESDVIVHRQQQPQSQSQGGNS